mmetsp:Transcript_18284/g.45004  ORF Transcript_18284/g.45004 Transcript_18284/m.45004 type:complete len:191 (+) Transcript_18284:69-641(+)
MGFTKRNGNKNNVSPGDLAPDFVSLDQHGNGFDLRKDVLSEGRLCILYFYPKDGDFFCTKQACALRDSVANLARYNAEVVGVSRDSRASHLRFAERYNLPFRLVSDEDGEVQEIMGVTRGLFGLQRTARTTFIIEGTTGRVIAKYVNQVNFKKHLKLIGDVIEKEAALAEKRQQPGRTLQHDCEGSHCPL